MLRFILAGLFFLTMGTAIWAQDRGRVVNTMYLVQYGPVHVSSVSSKGPDGYETREIYVLQPRFFPIGGYMMKAQGLHIAENSIQGIWAYGARIFVVFTKSVYYCEMYSVTTMVGVVDASNRTDSVGFNEGEIACGKEDRQ